MTYFIDVIDLFWIIVIIVLTIVMVYKMERNPE